MFWSKKVPIAVKGPIGSISKIINAVGKSSGEVEWGGNSGVNSPVKYDYIYATVPSNNLSTIIAAGFQIQQRGVNCKL